jgi:acyl-CoA reductase-like NAD-dependent aldehyde dehydrogenase
MWHEERLLIDGELVAAEGNRSFETIDPSTGKVLGTAADASVADAGRAVAAARRAFDTSQWATDVTLRVRCLRQLHEAFVSHQEDLRQLIVSEVGAPVMLTEGPQLESPVEMLRWYTDQLEKYEFSEDLGVTEAMGNLHQRWIEKEPVGVVAAIIPYNFPVQISLAKLAPALAAGCSVVLKGPPDTPWITAALGRLIAEETDIPRGVVNVLTGASPDVGEALVTDPAVDMVSFTGSTATGRRIMAAASDTVKKTFLELGGKSAFIVLDDADLALATMFAGFMICAHAGQGCAITTRLLVPRSKFDEAIEGVRGTMAGVPYGDPSDPSIMMGPLISERQRERVDGYVQGAVADGASVVLGGRVPEHLPDGFFYEPTLLVDVDPSSRIAQEEVFGPVLVAIPYEDDDDAVRIANDSIFGLSGAVYGGDNERAKNVARRLRTGTVSVNGGMYYAPDAPFGGFKQSGIGREMGVAGLEEYLETKTIAVPAAT